MFDFPTTPATGTTVTMPDGSFRVWDSQKWRASPSANVVIPPTGFLPLTGGNVSGILNLVDPGGALQSQRNITLASPSSTNPANQPFELIHTFTGTNLDPPTGMLPVLATSITNIFTAFNNGSAGMRGFQLQTRMDPGSYGGTFNGVYSTVTQNSPHPPGVITGTTIPFPWVANQDYPTAGVGVFNSLGQPYYVVTPGHSAATGPGPQGQGSAIIDGTVVWAYQGPGYPEYWAPGTNYPQRGVLFTNPNNGGMFRVETPGTSGAFPGPVRYRGAWSGVRVASTANVATLSGTPVIDGVTTAVNDRVLLKDQTAPASNGIYVVAAGAWTRSVETNTWPELPGGYTTVAAGSVNIGRTYQCTVAPGGTLETTPITFAQITLPNLTAIPDGSVVWSQKGIGNNATQYIGLIGNAQGAYNMGGRSYTESVGHQWGAVIGARLNPAATFYAENVGLEVDDNVNGSVRKTVGIQLVKQGFQGQFTDVGLWINTTVNVNGVAPAVANPRYKNAVLISRAADVNRGYGISFETFGNFERQHMAGCIDMRMVLADGLTGPFGGGFLLRGPNGMYDLNGAWQMRYGSITPTVSGLAIDVTNVELQSIAITSGGANWTVGDGWKATDGSFGTVKTVSGGAIQTITIVLPGQVLASAMPATVTLSPFNPENVFPALGSEPIPGAVGPTGDVVWPTPATGTPTYAAPATRTLNIGTGSTDAVNIGRVGATTTFAGTVSLPAGTVTGFLPLSGGIVAGPLTVTGQTQFNYVATTQPVLIQGNTALPIGGFVAGTALAIVGPDNNQVRTLHYGFGGGSSGLVEWNGYSARGSNAVPAAVSSNDILTRFSGRGYQGAAYANPAMMQIIATEAFGSTNTGTGFSFQGVLNGAIGNTEFFGARNGSFGVGVAADWGYKLDVNSATQSSRFLVTNATTAVIISGLTVAQTMPPVPANTEFMVVGAPSGANNRQAMFAGNNSINLLSFVKTAGTLGSAPSATPAQSLGSIEAMGYDTTWTTSPNANIVIASPALWSATSHPTQITFGTTPIGSVTLAEAMRVSPNGNLLVGTTTDPTGAGAVVCAQFVNGSAGPSWTSGSAVPASTQPKGSLYTRTGGAVGSTLYVSQGAGTWNAVAGV